MRTLIAPILAVVVTAATSVTASAQRPIHDPNVVTLTPPVGEMPGLLRMPDGSSYRLLAEPVQLAQATSGEGGGAAASGGAAGGAEAGGPDAGTDPSKAKRRLNVFHEFYQIKGTGFDFNTTTIAGVIPILGGGGTFGVNVPFTYAELPRANPFGLGDIYTRLILLPTKWEWFKERYEWPFKRVIPIVGTDIYFPTADGTLAIDPEAARITTVSLGTRKYRLSPLVGFVWAATEHWTVIPIYFHDFSVAGDPTAESIHQGKLRLFVQYQDPSGWYAKPEFQVVTDYNDNARTELYIAPEVGKVFKGGTTFYVKPGYGFLEHPNNRNWGIEAGIRTVF